MDYCSIMHESARIFNDRNPKYGDMKIGMERVSLIANLITGLSLTPHDVALVLHAVKLARLGEDRRNPDHYVDGINYLAFAGELINSQAPPNLDAAFDVIDKGFSDLSVKISEDKPENTL